MNVERMADIFVRRSKCNAPVAIRPLLHRAQLSNGQIAVGEHMVVDQEWFFVAKVAFVIISEDCCGFITLIGVVRVGGVVFVNELLRGDIPFILRANQDFLGVVELSLAKWLPFVFALFFLEQIDTGNLAVFVVFWFCARRDLLYLDASVGSLDLFVQLFLARKCRPVFDLECSHWPRSLPTCCTQTVINGFAGKFGVTTHVVSDSYIAI